MRVGGKSEIDGVRGCIREESRRACSELTREAKFLPDFGGEGSSRISRGGRGDVMLRRMKAQEARKGVLSCRWMGMGLGGWYRRRTGIR